MDNAVYYIPSPGRFRLKIRPGELPRFPVFFFTRLLWRVYPTGGHWLAHSVFYSALLLATLLVLLLDIVLLALYGSFQVLRISMLALGLLLLRLLEQLFVAVIYPTLKNILVFSGIIALTLFLIYHFDQVKQIILQLWPK